MTLVEKWTFVNDLTEGIKDSLLDKLCRVPEEWDGHELRQWISDYTQFAAVGNTEMNRTRMRDYKNEVLTRSL